MAADRTELNDLARKKPETAADLITQWETWAKEAFVYPAPEKRNGRKRKEIKMNIKHLLTIALISLTQHLFAAEPPNVIIILNDDQGYQDLGCYGSPKIKTPNVDALAEQGMRFTDFYVAASLCSASRGALLTGRYPERIGMRNVYFPNRDQGGLDPAEVTIAELLNASGYKTKAVGKWHLGDEKPYLPTNQGFDSYYGIPYSNDMYPAKNMTYAEDCTYLEGMTPQSIEQSFLGKLVNGCPWSLYEKVPLMINDQCIEFPADQRTLTRRFADEGIKFITESAKAETPFFLYLANSMPHVPLFASDDFRGKSEGGLYGDVIEEIDFNTGRILDHLKTLGLAENTIVIFTSDNGPWLKKGDHAGSALPLFEGKITRFEGGQRVPAIISWPGHIPAGSTCTEMALSLDLLPTIAHLTGATLPADLTLDGRNITRLLTEETGATTPHEYFFYGTVAVRSGDWKYHQHKFFQIKETAHADKASSLYNLRDDIGETKNLINEHPEIAGRLKKALDDFRNATKK